ncbi:PepSY domain-containing protein [Streptomyces sp. NEAU-L66]|uniref:PepSY domain-containing protein n=1 Tax=Streptomyces sp. NEAU-L66 TaxID=3390812 RepID=UPI0039C65129
MRADVRDSNLRTPLPAARAVTPLQHPSLDARHTKQHRTSTRAAHPSAKTGHPPCGARAWRRRSTPRAVVLATAAAVALIGGTGAATAFADDDGGPAPQSSVQLSHNERHLDDTAKDRAQVKADKISQSQATAKALKAVPGTATSAELDDDRNGSLVWEVEVFGKDHKSHEVIIDAGSGKVLKQHIDHDDHDNNDDQDDSDDD